jgi:SAM-dependent methyltransferase
MAVSIRRCRACAGDDLMDVLDLGQHPHASWFPTADELASTERWPLRLMRCTRCGLFQLGSDSPEEFEIEGSPAPTSSATMAAHADALVRDALDSGLVEPGAVVIDLASHGGHLAPFMARRGIVPIVMETVPWRIAELGAAGHVVEAAAPEDPAGQLDAARADAVFDFYRLAHVQDLAAAVAGIARLLKPGGVAVLEFDHALSTIAEIQFDSVRHGHFSYLTLGALAPLLGANGLAVVSAKRLDVYGGALRLVAVRTVAGRRRDPDDSVAEVRQAESAAGLGNRDVLTSLAAAVEVRCAALRAHLRDLSDRGLSIAGYGAPTRASTLLNAARITGRDIPYTVDRSAAKQDRFIPGAAIPIRAPDVLLERPPDEVLIFTWDIAAEVTAGLSALPGPTRFVVPLPDLHAVAAAGEPEAA